MRVRDLVLGLTLIAAALVAAARLGIMAGGV